MVKSYVLGSNNWLGSNRLLGVKSYSHRVHLGSTRASLIGELKLYVDLAQSPMQINHVGPWRESSAPKPQLPFRREWIVCS
jgi:hypothetical protein